MFSSPPRPCPPPPPFCLLHQEYARFSRIIFDTAPTGHTLRLLTLPDFVDASLGKVIRLRKKLAGAADAVKGLFGAGGKQDEIVAKLEKLQVGAGRVGCGVWGVVIVG